MKVFLIGFMGSGKSSLGKKLAKKMDYSFVDLDQEIEVAENRSISRIFSEHGEPYFRELEITALRKTEERENCIISVGGGTPVFHDNMKWMNAHGKTIYLRLSVEQLLSRLNQPNQIAKRPLLQNKNDQELHDLVAHMLKLRQSYYEQAQIILDGFGPHELTLPTLLQSY